MDDYDDEGYYGDYDDYYGQRLRYKGSETLMKLANDLTDKITAVLQNGATVSDHKEN